MPSTKYKVFPSAIFIVAIIVCISTVLCFTRDTVLPTHRSLTRKLPEAVTNCYIGINPHQRAVSTVLNCQNAVKSGLIGTQRPDSASSATVVSFAQKFMDNFKGINAMGADGVLKTFREEISREFSILCYAPLRRKIIFIVHPLLAFLAFYLLSKGLPMMITTIKKTGNGVSASVSQSRKKAEERSKLLRLKREEDGLLVASALLAQQENDGITENDRFEKMAVQKALKDEEDRLARAAIKANVDGQARKIKQAEETELRMAENQAKKNAQARQVAEQKAAREASALAAETTAQARRDDQLRAQAEKRAAQVEAARVAEEAIQAKKDEMLRAQLEKKAAQAEAARVAEEAIQAKKDEMLRAQAEKKAAQVEAARVAEAALQAKKDEMLRAQAEKKAAQAEASRVAEAALQAKKDEMLRAQAEKKAAQAEASRVAEAALQAKREDQQRMQTELKDRRDKAEATLNEERAALLEYKLRIADEAQQQALAKERAKDENNLSLVKEKEDQVDREAADKADRDEQAAQLVALKVKEEAARVAEKKLKELFEASERAQKMEDEMKARVAAAAKEDEEDRMALEAKMKFEREALEALQKRKEVRQLKFEADKKERDIMDSKARKQEAARISNVKKSARWSIIEKKWGPWMVIGDSEEPLPWLQRISTTMSVQAIINSAKGAEKAEKARVMETERTVSKAKKDTEENVVEVSEVEKAQAKEREREKLTLIDLQSASAIGITPMMTPSHLVLDPMSSDTDVTIATVPVTITATISATATVAKDSPAAAVVASTGTDITDITEDLEDVADSTKAAATITGAILGFKVLGPIGALAGATFANHYAAQKNVNGQVVRTIGETAVGSIDLIRSVDSKFEIVRNVEKVLKEAVSTSKANKAAAGAGAETDIKEIPEPEVVQKEVQKSIFVDNTVKEVKQKEVQKSIFVDNTVKEVKEVKKTFFGIKIP